MRVDVVSPGWVHTEATHAMMRRVCEASGTMGRAHQSVMAALGGIPIGPPASPEGAADLIAFLSSDRPASIHGSKSTIGGGTVPTV